MNLYGEDLTVNTDEHIFLEGDLSSVGISESQGGPRPTYSTLDEPIRETIFRDLKAVSQKFKHVIIPVDKSSLLSDWDLWGPLILCTFMAFVLENSGNFSKFHNTLGLCHIIFVIMPCFYLTIFFREGKNQLAVF